MNNPITNITGWDINSHTINVSHVRNSKSIIVQKAFSDWASKDKLNITLKEIVSKLGPIKIISRSVRVCTTIIGVC